MIFILVLGLRLTPEIIKFNPRNILTINPSTYDNCYTLYNCLNYINKNQDILFDYTESGFILSAVKFNSFMHNKTPLQYLHNMINGSIIEKSLTFERILLFKSTNYPFFRCMNTNFPSKNAYGVRLKELPNLWLLVSEYDSNLNYDYSKKTSISLNEFYEIQKGYEKIFKNCKFIDNLNKFDD